MNMRRKIMAENIQLCITCWSIKLTKINQLQAAIMSALCEENLKISFIYNCCKRMPKLTLCFAVNSFQIIYYFRSSRKIVVHILGFEKKKTQIGYFITSKSYSMNKIHVRHIESL